MSKIKMAKINPGEFRREVQGLLDIDPSGEMFCQILRATQELIHRAALYSDEGKDGWGEDLHHLTDTISDKIQNCSEHTIDELRSGYEYFMKGESSVITETADLINNIGYAHLSNMSKSNLKEGRRDWMEYLSDSLIDFWLSAAGVSSTVERGGKSFSSIEDFFSEKKDEAEAYADEKVEGITERMSKSFNESFWTPVKESGRNIGIGLMIGVGGGILLWFLYSGTKSAGNIAAAVTPQGRAASALRR